MGDVVNLLTLDVQRISEFLYYHHYVWITPITILIIMYVLWLFVGIASLSGLFTLIFLIVLNFAMVARSKRYEVSKLGLPNCKSNNPSDLTNCVLRGISSDCGGEAEK